jgi:nucleotide-binding universal stress UspA family protein
MDAQIEPGSIVVAVDGSEHADRAVEWAAEQAGLEGRRLVVVSVFEWGRLATSAPPGGLVGEAIGLDDLERSARAVADQAVALVRRRAPELDVDALIRLGDAREVLIDLSTNAHLVVMGSRGRGPLRTMLLGSVSSAVVKQARCPVVVCRPRPAQGAGSGVVVGADGTPESLPVIEFAFQQASWRKLPLTVLHAYYDAVTAVAGLRRTSGRVLPEPDVAELHVVLSESVAGLRERFPDVEVSLRLAHGLADEVLVSDQTWDLVVVGRHPVDSLGRVLIGSIANAVLERADTTVAVVPQTPSDS